jgi:hypothetical protein
MVETPTNWYKKENIAISGLPDAGFRPESAGYGPAGGQPRRGQGFFRRSHGPVPEVSGNQGQARFRTGGRHDGA